MAKKKEIPEMVNQALPVEDMKQPTKRKPALRQKKSEPEARETGKKIGTKEIRKAMETLKKYKDGKALLEQRAIENDQWWKMRHWGVIDPKRGKDTRFESAWLFNMLLNKHADAMDNFPEPVILPRERQDKEDAQLLSEIVPVVMEVNGIEEVYDTAWWSKLKNGTGIYGVFWNSRKENGLGDIEIREVDILNVFWEPGVEDIQRSGNFFCVEAADKKLLEEQYPQLKEKLTGGLSLAVADYIHEDKVDKTEKIIVVDWYYKVEDADGRVKLHYAKFAEEQLLFASENEEGYENGFYDHGQYPFVFDVMFPMEGSPAGFGYIDVAKKPQMIIDSLNEIITQNAWMSGRKRFFVKENSGVNEEEFADWDKTFVHVAGNLSEENLREFSVSSVPGFITGFLSDKVEELKETSGNNEIAQGGTVSGVTSGTAIAAMQEQNGKLSRDMIRKGYRAMVKVATLVVELIRQFYTEPRYFRIVGKRGDEQFITFTNAGMNGAPVDMGFGMEAGERRPVYDIKVKAQRTNPYSKMSQNDLYIQLYGMGLFNPEMADQAMMVLEGMQFEGKEELLQKVERNGGMLKQLQMMQMEMQRMAAIIDRQNGTGIGQDMAQDAQMQAGAQAPQGAPEQRKGSLADQARARAASVAKPT